jgi:hypothetical protein
MMRSIRSPLPLNRRAGLMLGAAFCASLASGACASEGDLFPGLGVSLDREVVIPAPPAMTSAANGSELGGMAVGDGGLALEELFLLGLLGPVVPVLTAAVMETVPVTIGAPAPEDAMSIFGFPLAGLWPTGVSAWLGLPPGYLLQGSGVLDGRSAANTASLQVLDGARIALTVWQGGFGNLLGPLRLYGEDHSVAVWQDGTGNLAFLGAILGFGQSVALRQLGTNIADILLPGYGEDNEIFVDQVGQGVASVTVEGARNAVTLRQGHLYGLGGDNMFRIEMDGVGNILRVEQDGDNALTVSVTGDMTNSVIGVGDPLRAMGLRAGKVTQSGMGNQMTIAVQGYGNLFGLRQAGDGATAVVTQQGNFNTTGVSQDGQSVTVTVTQTGSGNSVSVSQ